MFRLGSDGLLKTSEPLADRLYWSFPPLFDRRHEIRFVGLSCRLEIWFVLCDKMTSDVFVYDITVKYFPSMLLFSCTRSLGSSWGTGS